MNAFLLVELASQRARQLIAGAPSRIAAAPGAKATTVAIHEVLSGRVSYASDWAMIGAHRASAAGETVIDDLWPADRSAPDEGLTYLSYTTSATLAGTGLTRKDFGSWGEALEEAGFWQAVALLGVLGAVARPRDLPNGRAVQIVLNHYSASNEVLLSGRDERSGLTWDVREEHIAAARDGRLVGARWLAAKWNEWRAHEPQASRLVSASMFSNQGEVAEKLNRHAAVSFYCPLPALTRVEAVRRPMRIGFPPSDDYSLLRRSVSARSEQQPQAVQTAAPTDAAVDILVLRGDPVAALRELESLPIPVRANHVVLLTTATAVIDSGQYSALERVRARTIAHGLAVLVVRAGTERTWLERFLDEFTGHATIDRALINSAPVSPTLLFNRSVFEPAKKHRLPELFFDSLPRRQEVFEAISYFAMPYAVSHPITARWRRARPLQLTVWKERNPVVRFEAAARYELEAWIGGRSGSHTLPFPEARLPQGEDGHLLTVTLFAPGMGDGRPVVETLYLPPSGESTHCRFVFETDPQTTIVEARLTISHKNRVLQTYLVKGSVDGKPFEFSPEMATQSDWEGLETQPAYGVSLVLNRLSGKHRAVLQGGYQAFPFALEGLDDAITEIESTFDKSEWDADEFKTARTPGSRTLILFLAKQGFTLLASVKGYAKKDEAGRLLLQRLLDADPVQVLAANLGARLPIEFFYMNPYPVDAATVCPTYDTSPERTTCEGCPDLGASHYCPLGFWSLRKIIEWHDFEETQQRIGDFGPRPFVIATGDADRERTRLRHADKALVGISENADSVDKNAVTEMIASMRRAGIEPVVATSWPDWRAKVAKERPALLVLVPHTFKTDFKQEAMEIAGDSIEAPMIDATYVSRPGGPGPVVLVIGCNTDNYGVQFRNFTVKFMDAGSSVVVSTISQVLGRHAAPLTAALVTAIAGAQSSGSTTFGQLMREVRRTWLRTNEPPISLGLKCYGDARWRF